MSFITKTGIILVGAWIGLNTSCLAGEMVLESNELILKVSEEQGCFAVLDKCSGKEWSEDPWEQAAGLLHVQARDGKLQTLNLSSATRIELNTVNASEVQIVFKELVQSDGHPVPGSSVKTSLQIVKNPTRLIVKVLDVQVPAPFRAKTLEYPVRGFSLKTNVERGLAVIPYVQGVVVPSYMFPKRNSKFGVHDDSMYDGRQCTGKMDVYGYGGLSMPWYGIQTEKSGVLTVLPYSGSIGMKYIYNYNDRDAFIHTKFTESGYPRILSLYPEWNLAKKDAGDELVCYFTQGGDYVSMAKQYRELAKERGLFVSLKEKARQAPAVEKLAGDIYIHLYGGYPHYVNFPGMDFTFDEVKEMLTDLHDNLGVERLWLNLWGVWEKYPPQHWPPNQKAGGTEKLKAVVDLAKSYDYLVTTYYNWGCLLEHDPDYDVELLAKRSDGTPIFKNRWAQVDPDRWIPKSKEILGLVEKHIGFNANYNDSGQTEELRRHLNTLNMPVSSERKRYSEQSVPWFHRLEGMAPRNTKKPTDPYVEAPLFNLVYHDAILTSNRWQSPDNDYDLNGDYAVRCLRNMLYGNEVMYVVPPYEYPGIRYMIKQAVKLMAPLHKETAFEELVSHAYLSADMFVQRSVFGNGTVVTVNMALADQTLEDGQVVPGYGFIIDHADKRRTEGTFRFKMELETH